MSGSLSGRGTERGKGYKGSYDTRLLICLKQDKSNIDILYVLHKGINSLESVSDNHFNNPMSKERHFVFLSSIKIRYHGVERKIKILLSGNTVVVIFLTDFEIYELKTLSLIGLNDLMIYRE